MILTYAFPFLNFSLFFVLRLFRRSLSAVYIDVIMRFKESTGIRGHIQSTLTSCLIRVLHCILGAILHQNLALAVYTSIFLGSKCIASVNEVFSRRRSGRNRSIHLQHRQPIIFGSTSIPFELSSKLFEHLDRQDLVRASKVCKRWNAIVAPLLWRSPRFFYKLDKHLSDIYIAPIRTMWSTPTMATEQPYVLYQTLDAAEYRHGYQCQLALSRKPLGQYVRFVDFEFREHLVSDQTLADIAQYCPMIQHLSLAGCCQITDTSLRLLSRGKLRHSLKSIDLSDCPQITDDGLSLVSQRFYRLQRVALNGCTGISNAGILTLVRNSSLHDWPCPPRSSLLEIYLRRCSSLSGLTIQYVATTCGSSLRALNLAETAIIGDKEIRSIAKHCVSLLHLSLARSESVLGENHAGTDMGQSILNTQDLDSATAVTVHNLQQQRENVIVDDTIEYLVKHLPSLCYLDLSNITSITNTSIFSISKFCPNLKTLVLVGCHGITDTSLPFLAELHRQHGQLVNITLGGSNGDFSRYVNSIEHDVNWQGWTHEPLNRQSAE